MHAIRQKCRPKHQVLILNCYPRTIKGAVDVKPNSSELSYLLYYATTRRSKVQKVGAFLEKKTASDVWRARIGNVQVTLQIVAALIEKAPRDLPLYASHILKLLNIILSARDITMIESSLPTFGSFCQNHDEASLSADQEYLCQYEDIVSMYASFASANYPVVNPATSTPIALRWKNAGLEAIKSVVSAEALSSIAGRLLYLIVPTLLDNVWCENPDFINLLENRVQAEEKFRTKSFSRRRASVATVQTVESTPDAKAALSRTTADADKVAEADIIALSLQCLKLVFVVNNKAQIHGATLATLKYIGERGVEQGDKFSFTESRAVQIFQMISRWAPVQDRYTILVTAMDILQQTQSEEENILQQLLYITMIDSLLKSDINLIGLSVMDILLGLIKHILYVLQLSSSSSNESKDSGKINSMGDSQWPLNNFTETLMESSSSKQLLRKRLLEKLQLCIGNLATHIYYVDQISDMVSALLWRIKPYSSVNTQILKSATDSSTIPVSMINPTSDHLEESKIDGLFTSTAAKVKALGAVNSILLTAGLRKSFFGAGNLARNNVSTRVWEGTHWLLYDHDFDVRKAYATALLTWMEHEISKPDLRTSDIKPISSPRIIKDDYFATLSTKRTMSSTWTKDKAIMTRSTRSTFLELLHLAVFENTLKYPESGEDIIILHILLDSLVDNLGINAVKSGLPMIFRLQEDVSKALTPLAKINISSLCYAYFWTLREKFNLSSTPIDIEIHREIHRRQKQNLWLNKLRCPPHRQEQIQKTDKEDLSQSLSLNKFNPDSLRPFTKRSQMVELIYSSYVEALMVQVPISPSSPSRTCSHSFPDPLRNCAEFDSPEVIKEQMMSEWSQEAVKAAAEQSSRSVSLNGSKTGTNTLKHRNILALSVNDRSQSPPESNQMPLGHKTSSRSGSTYGYGSGLGTLKKTRRTSERSPTSLSDSRRSSITRVEYLKKVLSGQDRKCSRGRTPGNVTPSDASSESMISYAYTTSDISFNPSHSNLSQLELSASDHESNKLTRTKSTDDDARFVIPLPSNSIITDQRSHFMYNSQDLDLVPPIPSIPRVYKDEAAVSPDIIEDNRYSGERKVSRSKAPFYTKESPVTLDNFLKDIQVGSDGINISVANPPY